MAAKLSDSELARRVRERSQQRSSRYRERLARAGRVQTLIWIPDGLRRQLDALAAERNETLSAISTELLSAALNTTTNYTPATTTKASNDATLDMFATNTKENDFSFVSVGNDKDALMNEVGKLRDAGLSGEEIARRLNAAGHRTAKGTELIGNNLLRDYRKWRSEQ